jgi:hypothetical protein
MEINLSFIGGLFEGEGSFSISIAGRSRKGRPWLSITPMARIGMKEHNSKMLTEIRDFLGIGKIYYSGNGDERLVSWQTTNSKELLDFTIKIKDYLYNKREQADIMLKILDIYYLKYIDKGNKAKKRTKEDLMQIVKYSRSINSLCSVNARRRQNLRGVEYWEKMIDKVIEYRESKPMDKGGMPKKFTDEQILAEVKRIETEGYSWKKDRNWKELANRRFGSWDKAVSLI